MFSSVDPVMVAQTYIPMLPSNSNNDDLGTMKAGLPQWGFPYYPDGLNPFVTYPGRARPLEVKDAEPMIEEEFKAVGNN